MRSTCAEHGAHNEGSKAFFACLNPKVEAALREFGWTTPAQPSASKARVKS